GEIETERHRNDVGAFVRRPLECLEDRQGIAALIVWEDLGDERLPDISGDANASVSDVLAEDRAGAMRSMSVFIAVARSSEILLFDIHARESRMSSVDSRVEDCDSDAGSVEVRPIGTHGRDTPG